MSSSSLRTLEMSREFCGDRVQKQARIKPALRGVCRVLRQMNHLTMNSSASAVWPIALRALARPRRKGATWDRASSRVRRPRPAASVRRVARSSRRDRDRPGTKLLHALERRANLLELPRRVEPSATLHHGARLKIIGGQRVAFADFADDLLRVVRAIVIEQQVRERPAQLMAILFLDGFQSLPQLRDRFRPLALLTMDTSQRQV